jgi:hypothetical protein
VPSVMANSTQYQETGQGEPYPVKLNAWSRYLVLLSIHVQILEFSQEMSLVGKICRDGTYDDTYATEAENVASRGCSGLRESHPPTHVEGQENHLRAELPDSFCPSMADQIRERLRGSNDTCRWSIWPHLAATKTQLAGDNPFGHDTTNRFTY